jgi:hypothetical protein
MKTGLAILTLAAAGVLAAQPGIPHLRKQGAATQLVVDGKPFLVLGGELHNSSASSLEYMKPVWKRLKDLNLNTVLAAVSWELLEPEEGRYDFTLVDGLIRDARLNNLKLIFLWFGSWKNGVSTYPPVWVKTDLQRFPRAQNKDGVYFDVISPLSAAARDADAKAFAALMRHIREVDGRQHTVLMMQVENEVGLLGDSRDRSALAQAAWNAAVPAELMSYLQKHRAELIPELAEVWHVNGNKTEGAWPEVFGDNPAGHEVFMAWRLARYIGGIAALGKAEYPIPMYVNAWLVQNPSQQPGQYPSGGPVSRMIDVWRAAAPGIDLLAPDIYLPDFKGVCAGYTRSGNPLFIPEAHRGPVSAANVFWAVAQHDAIGFAPFGIDGIEGEHPLAKSYELLSELMPLIARHNGTGKMIGVLEDKEPNAVVRLGDYQLRIEFGRQRSREPNAQGYGLIIQTGADEYLAAGSGFSVHFTAVDPAQRARIAFIDEGRFVAGVWKPGRRLNGDENAGGERLILPGGRLTVQKLKLYTHPVGALAE